MCKSFFLSLLSDTTLISTFQTALPISLGDFSFLLFFPYFSLSVLCFIFPQTDIFICGMNDTRVVIIVFPTFVVRFCVIRWLLGYYLFCLWFSVTMAICFLSQFVDWVLVWVGAENRKLGIGSLCFSVHYVSFLLLHDSPFKIVNSAC